jgi:hypothetical protein
MDMARSGIEADRKNYKGMEVFRASAETEISKMLLADAKARGPQQIRMAPQYTRHRLARALQANGRDRRICP